MPRFGSRVLAKRPKLTSAERQPMYAPAHSGVAFLVPGIPTQDGLAEVFVHISGIWSAEDLEVAARRIRAAEERLNART